MSEYVNTGYQRATVLRIKVIANGVEQSSNDFPFKESFTLGSVIFEAITNVEVAQMSTVDYNARVTAYAAYIEANYQAQYPGLSVTTVGARIENLTACPLP